MMDCKSEVKELIDKSIFLIEKGEYDEVIDVLNKILEIDPKCARALQGKAIVNENLGNIQKALNYTNEALKIDSKYEKALYNKSRLLNILGEVDSALKATEDTLNIYPKNLDALNQRGIILTNTNRIDEGIECYDDALKIDPHFFYALVNKGFALYLLKKYNEATQYLNNAIKIEPKNYLPYFYKGLVFDALNDLESALTSYDTAIALEPGTPEDLDVMLNRGIVLSDLGRTNAALLSYNKILEIDPDYVEAWNNRGYVYGDLIGDYKTALESLDEALKRDPNCPESLYLKSFYIRKNANEEARKLEKKLIYLKHHKIFLEEQLEYNLAENISLLKDFGYELRVIETQYNLKDRNGRIDILCEDYKDKGFLIIELKNVIADIKTFHQISEYIESINNTIARNKPVKGLVISRGYDKSFEKQIKDSEISQLNLEDLGFE